MATDICMYSLLNLFFCITPCICMQESGLTVCIDCRETRALLPKQQRRLHRLQQMLMAPTSSSQRQALALACRPAQPMLRKPPQALLLVPLPLRPLGARPSFRQEQPLCDDDTCRCCQPCAQELLASGAVYCIREMFSICVLPC